MSKRSENAARVGRAIAQWWTAEAMGERGTAEILQAAAVRELKAESAGSDRDIERAYSNSLVVQCWHEFLQAQSSSDRNRIAQAAATLLLQQLPHKAPAASKSADSKRPDNIVHMVSPTDSLYYTPKPQGGAIVFVSVAFLLLLKACASV